MPKKVAGHAMKWGENLNIQNQDLTLDKERNMPSQKADKERYE